MLGFVLSFTNMFSLFLVVENLGCIIFSKELQNKYLTIGYMLGNTLDITVLNTSFWV